MLWWILYSITRAENGIRFSRVGHRHRKFSFCRIFYNYNVSSFRQTYIKRHVIKKHYITACNIRHIIHEPGHERMCLMSYTNNKGADQPTHPHSAFVIHCLDSIISLDSIAEISRL